MSLGSSLIVFGLMLCSGGEDGLSYSEAHRLALDSRRPLLVFVGASWCGPCRWLKQEVLPQLRQRGAFEGVVLAFVDVDRESELAQKVTGGGPVPQLVLYRRTRDGWGRSKLVGAQSVDQVERFLKGESTDDTHSEGNKSDRTAGRVERDRQES